MKKVAIVSCYFKHNYGSMLQAYATKKILDNNNILNETINTDENVDFKNGKRKYYITQLFNFNFIKSKFGMIKLKVDKKIVKGLNKNINIRDKKYDEFVKEFNLSKPFKTYSDLSEYSKDNYSNVIVGSDQLWLPVNVVADYYTLNWVPNNINKISYSTSFGVASVPSKYIEKYNHFLNRINHLSIREESGIKLAKKLANVDGELVCDPTLLLTKKEWEEVSVEKRIVKDKYILCYFLGSNKEHRNFALKLKKKTGYKIVSLNHADEYVKYSDVISDDVLYNVGPREWINLVKNAEYICTDSFHCTVFSLIFNKEFFDFRRYKSSNKISTNTRIDSLLKTVGVNSQRILTGSEEIEKVLKYKIDYIKVNKNIEKFREQSIKWLLDSIMEKDLSVDKSIDITNKALCSGCSACMNICPKEAIQMVEDDEGFLYPKIDSEKCINCGLCKRICPILNKKDTNMFKQKGYIFQYYDEKIRKESTSGGFFTALSDYVIENKGIVFGAAFNEKLKVEHQFATNKDDLEKFRNSKYVQSDLKNTFKDVKRFLNEEKLVCYSGTACQIEGLLSYLGKNYTNLITVDVICRAVPSPMLWNKYIESKGENIKRAYFREKKYGYKYSNLTIYDEKKLVYNNGVDTDQYLRAFFSNICCRPSCYSCHFKSQFHKADFTIWDCFNVNEYDETFDDDIGTTRVLINSEKAMDIFDSFKTKHKSKEVDVNSLISNFHQMFNSIKHNDKREQFFNDLNNKDFEFVMRKYFPITLKCRLEKYVRIGMIKCGVYKTFIKIGKKIRSRD